MGSPVTREEEEDTGCPPRTPDRQRGICLSAGYVLRPLRGYSPLPPRHGSSPHSAAFEHAALPFVCLFSCFGTARSGTRVITAAPQPRASGRLLDAWRTMLQRVVLCCNAMYYVAHYVAACLLSCNRHQCGGKTIHSTRVTQIAHVEMFGGATPQRIRALTDSVTT